MAGGLRERSVAIRRYGITYRGGIYLKKNKTMIVVFLTPAVLLFLGIFLYPIIRTVIMSFFKIDTRGDVLTPMPLGNDLPAGTSVHLLSHPEGYP